jgi:4-hydroxybenzoate polyprenyltransferase
MLLLKKLFFLSPSPHSERSEGSPERGLVLNQDTSHHVWNDVVLRRAVTFILLLRLPQWSKAVFVFLGVIYAEIPGYLWLALCAALAFCLTASSVYIYNDLQDMDEDKAHPIKSHRPLASGAISTSMAVSLLVFFLFTGLLLGFVISSILFKILVTYLFINVLYNHWLRRVLFVDVLCIASGFMLRILAGTIGIGLPITWWLTITATLLCLFIALCKRRLELKLGLKNSKRAVLRKYKPHVLNILIVSTASSCFITYLFYTLYAHDKLFYFLWTLPFGALGLWRFSHMTIISERNNDDPFLLFLSDRLSLLNLFCFLTFTVMAFVQ